MFAFLFSFITISGGQGRCGPYDKRRYQRAFPVAEGKRLQAQAGFYGYLLREVNMEGTLLKVLLSQLRRNAERNGIIPREDLTTPVMNIKAAYVEKKFEEMGLL